MSAPLHSILAVDDNEVHCYALMKLLEHSGFTVRVAMSGRAALESALNDPPHLVLLDINLPDVNGYEVCERLKQQDGTKDVPIVFHTATAANEPARAHALAVGADAFLTYPVERDHLVSVIKGCIAKHHGKRE